MFLKLAKLAIVYFELLSLGVYPFYKCDTVVYLVESCHSEGVSSLGLSVQWLGHIQHPAGRINPEFPLAVPCHDA